MAILTISVNSNYSAIKGSLANGDTIRIDTNTVRLTVDEQPLLTNITVDSPGVSGRMTVSGAYDLSTWAIIAGTVPLIDGTLPAGATLGSATGGTANSAFGIATNAGTVLVSNGSAGQNAHGVSTNNGTVTTATGGSFSGANGVLTNNARVIDAFGGSGVNTRGVSTNFGVIGSATGGSGAASSEGCAVNNGTVTTATGSALTANPGVGINRGSVLRAFDFVGRGVLQMLNGPKFILGPDWQTATTDYQLIEKIYSLGEVSNLAAIPVGIEIVTLSEGAGGGFSLSRVLN
jgi:hypothetical protein